MAAEMVRINTRISKTLNEWLDSQSEQTGLPKSTIVMLALENYYQQKEVMRNMSDMSGIMQKLEEVQRTVEGAKK